MAPRDVQRPGTKAHGSTRCTTTRVARAPASALSEQRPLDLPALRGSPTAEPGTPGALRRCRRSPLRSEAILERLHGIGLDDRPRGFGLHHHNLAKDLAFPCLRRGFLTGLDHAQPWDRQLANFFDLLRRDVGEGVDYLHHLRSFDLRLRRDGP